ncbi:MAG: DUF1489 domain-containing protein [Pseudomonadota bacterium]
MEQTGSQAALSLVKLCVGVDTIEDLATWQSSRTELRRHAGADPRPRHVTRMWPRRVEEMRLGTEEAGSLYWVIKGLILVRQRILALEEVVGEDGISRCGLVLDPALVRTESRPRRVFQGWRYLPAADAPSDLGPWQAGSGGGEYHLPVELEAALDAIGVGAAGR